MGWEVCRYLDLRDLELSKYLDGAGSTRSEVSRGGGAWRRGKEGYNAQE